MSAQPLEAAIVLIAHVAETLLCLFCNFLEGEFLEKNEFQDLALPSVEQPETLLYQARGLLRRQHKACAPELLSILTDQVHVAFIELARHEIVLAVETPVIGESENPLVQGAPGRIEMRGFAGDLKEHRLS